MNIIRSKYEAVIGLEVHAQLSTQTKIFCGCSTEYGAPPNTNVCPVCLGHPGVLPVLNEKAVDYILLMGLALNCRINSPSFFARKNYFYPDLPKGYQISQFEMPFCENGSVELDISNGVKKNIRIKRIHLEEDAGKLMHGFGGNSLVDINRCGTPLIEIVTEPDFFSGPEANIFLNKIKQILRYLNICDGNMEEGSIRCDANVSVSTDREKKLGVKTEVKNMNSFRNVEKAVEFEIDRQIEIIEDGGHIVQETLLWDADAENAFSMRSKEEAHDYRYFPEPDLVPVSIPQSRLEFLKNNLPELPDFRKNKFINEYNLSGYDAGVLTSEKEIADYFENVIKSGGDAKSAANWIMGDILAYLKEKKISILSFPLPPENLAGLINLINDGDINNKIAKDIFPEMIIKGKKASDIIEEKGLKQIKDADKISSILDKVLNESTSEIEEYISGKEKVIGFLVGKVMKATSGKANPAIVNKILKEKLELLKSKR